MKPELGIKRGSWNGSVLKAGLALMDVPNSDGGDPVQGSSCSYLTYRSSVSSAPRRLLGKCLGPTLVELVPIAPTVAGDRRYVRSLGSLVRVDVHHFTKNSPNSLSHERKGSTNLNRFYYKYLV